MRKEYRVSIDPELSLNIERQFYEWKGGQENIAFLMKEKDVNHELLQEYINIVETRYASLEMLKTAAGKEFCPEFLKKSGEDYAYTFLFDSCEILYTAGESDNA